MAVLFRVQHLDHLGSVISTHTPVGGSLEWEFRANEVGEISYQIAQSDIEDQNLGALSFAPYRTDWRLQQKVGTGSWESIAAGIHVPVNIHSDEDAVNVAGKDWAHWLEQPVWFDYYDFNWSQAGLVHATRKDDIIEDTNDAGGWTPGANNIYSGKAVLAFMPGAIQAAMINELVDNTKRGTDYVNISTVFTGTAGSGTLVLDSYVIFFQDQSTVLQHINNVAALDNPYGFDWTMNANKQMEFFGPRKVVAQAPTPIWTITKDSILEQPIIDLDWTNNGPLGTHIVGLSRGSPSLWWYKKDQDSIDKFREWLKIEKVGDSYIKGPDMRYAVNGLQYIHPQKDITITILPEVVDPFEGFKNHVGDVVRVKWDFPPHHEVNAYYWITGQRFHGDAPGNYMCDLALQQIYG